MKNFLDEILNYRSAGPLSVPVHGTGTKRKILAGPEPGPKKKLPVLVANKKSYRDLDRRQKSWSRTSLVVSQIQKFVDDRKSPAGDATLLANYKE